MNNRTFQVAFSFTTRVFTTTSFLYCLSRIESCEFSLLFVRFKLFSLVVTIAYFEGSTPLISSQVSCIIFCFWSFLANSGLFWILGSTLISQLQAQLAYCSPVHVLFQFPSSLLRSIDSHFLEFSDFHSIWSISSPILRLLSVSLFEQSFHSYPRLFFLVCWLLQQIFLVCDFFGFASCESYRSHSLIYLQRYIQL